MKFVLEVRRIEARDLSAISPFLPDDDEYEMHLTAMLENLTGISGISEVTRNGSVFRLKTTYTMLPAELKALIKPAFTPDAMTILRFVSLLGDVA